MNTSPLILLSKIGLLDRLRAGDLPVIVPQAVLDEIARHGPEDQSLLRRDPLSAVGSSSIPNGLVARADAESVDEILEPLWDGDRTLIVVSSDLNHLHPS